MKKGFFITLAVLAVSAFNAASAQTVYTTGRTTLKVTFVQKKEVLKAGPYAKYAQKYLGVAAPLSDKSSYEILGASIASIKDADPANVYAAEGNISGYLEPAAEGGFVSAMPGTDSGLSRSAFANPYVEMGVVPFVEESPLAVNRTSATERSMEEMASEAAKTIFHLRKRRLELITGDQGENVFGEGLRYALEEIRRMEEAYTALFLGKSTVSVETKTYEVVPDENTAIAMACRFSALAGLVDVSDISGQPVMVEMTYDKPAVAQAKPKGTTVKVRIPVNVACKVTDGKTVLTQQVLPILQFGPVVDIPVGK